jgi:hypothetical protein
MNLTPNLNLQLLQYNQIQKEIVVNEALIIIDTLLNNAIKNILNEPPPNPKDGDTYIIDNNAIKEWRDKTHYLAFYYNGWRYIKPKIGLQLWLESEQAFYLFDGTKWINKFFHTCYLADQKIYELCPNSLNIQYEIDITKDCKIILKNELQPVGSITLIINQAGGYKISWSDNINFSETPIFDVPGIYLLKLYKRSKSHSWIAIICKSK